MNIKGLASMTEEEQLMALAIEKYEKQFESPAFLNTERLSKSLDVIIAEAKAKRKQG